MIFNEIRGNDALIATLRKNIENGKIVHAYILEGSKAANKLRFALGFAEELGCKNPDNHPDVLIISHEGISIKDEELSKVQEDLMTAPMLAKHNIVIIDGADSITQRAQNRMLKTLEEPQSDSIIILLSENSQSLLETVRSRCVTLHINEAEREKTPEELELERLAGAIVRDIQGGVPFYKLMQEYEQYFIEKRYCLLMIDAMENVLAQVFVEAACAGEISAVSKAVAQMQRAKRDLQIGVNFKYAMKNLIIKLEDIL